MVDIDIRVDGLRELERRLLKLGAQVGEKQLNSALMNASLPAFKRAKNGAPGSIKKAIVRRKIRGGKKRKIQVKGVSSTGRNAAEVSILINAKKAPHGHLLELGTKPRYTTGSGKKKRKYKAGAFRGKGPAKKFMTKAWEAEGGEKAVKRFRRFLGKRLTRLGV